MRKLALTAALCVGAISAIAPGQSTSDSAPATRPTTDNGNSSPEKLLDQMLKTPANAPKSLRPSSEGQTDKTSGKGAVAPSTPAVPLQREGTYIFDRVGRLSRSADGTQAEFTFESDGKTLKDPPVIILPNLKLMTMEEIVKVTNRDLRFRVTGMLTEYRGRNYLLLEKVLVPPEGNGNF